MIKIAVVMVVRNEADVLGLNLHYHAAQGVREFRIVDNGSSDGTPLLLREMAGRLNLVWSRDDGPFRQADMVTGLAREAFHAGADWVVPVDADEFWSAGSLRLAEALQRSPADMIAADVVNFIQERSAVGDGPAGLLTMLHRTEETRGDADQTRELVEAGQIAFVEIAYPRKCLFRSCQDLTIGAGAHDGSGVSDPVVESGQVVCLHAPIRSRQILDARAEHGRRVIEAGYPPSHGWQNQRWHRLQAAGRLDEEWVANSVRDSHLGDRRTPVVFDPRLRDSIRSVVTGDIQAAALL